MEELTRIADAMERIADKQDMLAETGAEIEQDLDALAECTGYIAPPVYAPAEAKGAHYFRIGGSVDAGQQEGEKNDVQNCKQRIGNCKLQSGRADNKASTELSWTMGIGI